MEEFKMIITKKEGTVKFEVNFGSGPVSATVSKLTVNSSDKKAIKKYLKKYLI